MHTSQQLIKWITWSCGHFDSFIHSQWSNSPWELRLYHRVPCLFVVNLHIPQGFTRKCYYLEKSSFTRNFWFACVDVFLAPSGKGWRINAIGWKATVFLLELRLIGRPPSCFCCYKHWAVFKVPWAEKFVPAGLFTAEDLLQSSSFGRVSFAVGYSPYVFSAQ